MNIIRVISGTARGLKLNTVPGKHTRPTSDKVKESLFNILASHIEGARVLDLFSGTGSLAVEALSRGAESAVLVEHNRAALAVIHKNLEKASFLKSADVMAMDVFYAINKLSLSGEKFDIIFIDPPYGKGLARECARMIFEGDLLTGGGIIAAEVDANDGSEANEDGPDAYRIKKYGRTVLRFYRKAMPPGNGDNL